jgi:GNAT superfamily N-acetyltransferase
VIIEVREAVTADLPAVCDVAMAVDPPDEGAEVEVGYYAYLIDTGVLLLAEAGGVVLGYAGAVDVAGSRHLSDLFVHPDAQGQGIGKALLDEIWTSDANAVPRQTFSSQHSSALPVYVRHGLTPRWPLIYMRGNPAALPPTSLTLRGIEAVDAAAVEQEWLGWDRTNEYTFWGGRQGARTFVVLDGHARVGVGCIKRTRMSHSLSHLAVADASAMPDVLAAAATWAGDELQVSVPGANRVLPVLLDAGWRIVDQDTYCASAPGLMDADLVLPHEGLL